MVRKILAAMLGAVLLAVCAGGTADVVWPEDTEGQRVLKEYAETVPHTNPAEFTQISGSPLQPEYVSNKAAIPHQRYPAYNPELPQQPESLQNTAFLKNSSKEDASEYQNYLKQVHESSFTASL